MYEEDNTGFKKMDERKGQGSDDEGALSLAMIPLCFARPGDYNTSIQAHCCPFL